MSWATVAYHRGLSKPEALAESGFKLLCWHIGQPVGYFLVYGCAISQLDNLQVWLGGVVAVREALYVLMVMICTWL